LERKENYFFHKSFSRDFTSHKICMYENFLQSMFSLWSRKVTLSWCLL
jgi:hypothetical protein